MPYECIEYKCSLSLSSKRPHITKAEYCTVEYASHLWLEIFWVLLHPCFRFPADPLRVPPEGRVALSWVCLPDTASTSVDTPSRFRTNSDENVAQELSWAPWAWACGERDTSMSFIACSSLSHIDCQPIQESVKSMSKRSSLNIASP